MKPRIWAVLVSGALLAGCATISPAGWDGNKATLERDSSECERQALAAGSRWMDASPVWRAVFGIKSTAELYDGCMVSRGYQRSPSTSG